MVMDMDTTLPITPTDTTLDTDMARGPRMLSLDMVTAMLSAITTEAPRVSTDTMEVTDMVVIMARGLLRLDIMAMDMPMVAAATSMLTGHTLPMVSVLLT